MVVESKANDPDRRIDELLAEADSIGELNTGEEYAHENPALVSWYLRAKTAVADKLGEDSHLFIQMNGLQFWGFLSMNEDTPPSELRRFFSQDLAKVIGALKAALEAKPRSFAGRGPLVQVNQHQEGARAEATSSATVAVNISVDELRSAIATAPGLSADDRAEGMTAVPDDPADLTLEQADKLLGLAAKAQALFKPILGWLLASGDHIEWPG